jgi:hypothetical protein
MDSFFRKIFPDALTDKKNSFDIYRRRINFTLYINSSDGNIFSATNKYARA